MKSEIEIVDDVYQHIKSSGMMNTLNGNIHKDIRLEPFSNEDVVVSVVAKGMVGDVQEAYVNVNIYVHDLNVRGQRTRDRKRIGLICKLAEQKLKVGGLGKDYTFHLQGQQVYEVTQNEASPEHKINNKLLYQIIDE